jgi:hypothetical protein
MNGFELLITCLIVIVILMLAIGIGWWIRNHNKQINIPPADPALINVSHWSATPVPTDDPTRNVCTLYDFSSSTIIIDGVPTFVPGVATLNASTLDHLTGRQTALPLCVDSDQIVAKEVTHTCISPSPNEPSLITVCQTLGGMKVPTGTTENFYQACNQPTCAGEIALVSVNYQVPTNDNPFCIVHTTAANPVTMSPCNPGEADQRFRITRINPGQNPGSLVAGGGQTGLLAQILDRQTGLCLAQGEPGAVSTWNPAYGGCGSVETFAGFYVRLAPCASVTPPPLDYPGYNWLMLPSFEYCSVPGGCTAAERYTTAPQIVYVGNIDLSTIPLTTFQGLTGLNAIYKWAMVNHATALYYGGGATGPILRELAGPIDDCTNAGYISQYLNTATYNKISEYQVCLANQQATGAPCVPL